MVLAKETELNVYLIGNVKKYIRINVKPNGQNFVVMEAAGGNYILQDLHLCICCYGILVW